MKKIQEKLFFLSLGLYLIFTILNTSFYAIYINSFSKLLMVLCVLILILKEILLKELPIAGLYFETSTVYYKQGIEGELNPTINNIYSGLENMMEIN